MIASSFPHIKSPEFGKTESGIVKAAMSALTPPEYAGLILPFGLAVTGCNPEYGLHSIKRGASGKGITLVFLFQRLGFARLSIALAFAEILDVAMAFFLAISYLAMALWQSVWQIIPQ